MAKAQTRLVAQPVITRALMIRAQSLDESARTVEAVISTGAEVRRYDWFAGDEFIEKLGMDPGQVRLDRLIGAPVCDSHRHWESVERVLGAVRSARLENGALLGTLYFTEGDARADALLNQIRQGVISKVSVGYEVHHWTDGGEQDGVRVLVASDWSPFEVSAVAVPADPAAAIRSTDPARECRAHAPAGLVRGESSVSKRRAKAGRITGNNGGKTMPDTKAAGGASRMEDMTDDQRLDGDDADEERADDIEGDDAEGEGAEAEGDEERTAPRRKAAKRGRSAQDIARGERQRISGIELAARKLGLDPQDKAVRALITGEVSLNAARAKIIDMAADNAKANRVNPTVPAQPDRSKKGGMFGRMILAQAGAMKARMPTHQYASEIRGDQEVASYYRALLTNPTASGGALVPTEVSNEVIELLRPVSVIRKAVPATRPLPNGKLDLPRMASGAAASWRGEAQPAAVSEGSFDTVKLSAKILDVIIPVSEQLIRYAGPDVEASVTEDGVSAIGTAEDKGYFVGTGGEFTPRGLFNQQGIQVLDASAANDLGEITAVLEGSRQLLLDADVRMLRPVTFLTPGAEAYLRSLRDGTGNYVYRAEMLTGFLNGMPYFVSNNVPKSADGTDHQLMVADMVDVVIGQGLDIMVDVSTEASIVVNGTQINAFQSGMVLTKVTIEVDIALRHPKSVVHIKDAPWYLQAPAG